MKIRRFSDNSRLTQSLPNRSRWFRSKIIFFTIILFSAIIGNNLSYGKSIKLTTEVNKKRITVGEKFTLTITLEMPKDEMLHLPILSGKIGDFLIKDYQLVKNPISQPDKKIEKIAYSLVIYETGERKIPSLKYRYGNNETRSSPIPITIESVLLPGDQELEPLKPNIANQGKLVWWAYPLGGMAFILLVLFLRKLIKAIFQPRHLPYYETALIQLNKIKKEINLIGVNKNLYYRLDKVLKRFYAEYQENPELLTMTTKQILSYIRNTSGKHNNFFNAFVSQSDIIKFSSNHPNIKKIHSQIKEFEKIILEVKEAIQEEKKSKKKITQVSVSS